MNNLIFYRGTTENEPKLFNNEEFVLAGMLPLIRLCFGAYDFCSFCSYSYFPYLIFFIVVFAIGEGGTLLPRIPYEQGSHRLTIRIDKIGLKDAASHINSFFSVHVKG